MRNNKNWFKSLLASKLERGNSAEMSFFDHLSELRKHLIRSALAICFFTFLSFTYYDFIFDKIILGPKKEDFLTYRLLCYLSRKFDLGSEYCIKEIHFNLINTEMAGQFTLQINSSVMTGLILAFPYLLFELWSFIKPALTMKERKATTGFVFYSSLLFFLGIFFGYFVIAPYSIRFLVGFQVSEAIQNQIEINSYLSSIITLTLGTGLTFELPIIVLILAQIGLLTPKLMRSSRRYAIVLMLIIAAIITPTPDMQTMLIVFCPLFVLYEISIVVAHTIEKKKGHLLQ